MSILFKCDTCGFSTASPKDMITSNILHLAKDRTGADVDTTSALLPTTEHADYCHACYRQLKDWINGGLRQHIKDNFPLIKQENVIH